MLANGADEQRLFVADSHDGSHADASFGCDGPDAGGGVALGEEEIIGGGQDLAVGASFGGRAR